MFDRRQMLGLTLAAAAAAAQPARAEDWPAKPVTLVMPYPAGGSMDVFVRVLAERLSALWKQPVLVDNRAGATEIIAATSVAKAKPDGYTLYMATEVGLETNPFLFSSLPYNPLTDFTPITRLVEGGLVYVVSANSPITSMEELFAAAKREPNKISYGSTGLGGMVHLAINSLAVAGDASFLHVPFRGSAPALLEVMADRVTFTGTPATAVMPFIESNRVRALATSGSTRVRALPAVPTLEELGYRGLVSTYMYAMVGPARMPESVADKIARDVAAVLRTPEFQERNVDPYGYVIVADTPAEFSRYLSTNKDRVRARVESAHVKLD